LIGKQKFGSVRAFNRIPGNDLGRFESADAPKMGRLKLVERGEYGLEIEIIQLKMLGLKKQALVPE